MVYCSLEIWGEKSGKSLAKIKLFRYFFNVGPPKKEIFFQKLFLHITITNHAGRLCCIHPCTASRHVSFNIWVLLKLQFCSVVLNPHTGQIRLHFRCLLSFGEIKTYKYLKNYTSSL